MSGRSAPGSRGAELYELVRELFPLPRSLSGNGVRRTLEVLRKRIPLEVTEVPAGSAVYDWVVPPEWNISEAWIEDEDGRRIVDFADSSLHVVGYSQPVRARLRGRELEPHLHSLPEDPEATPYRTSYYERSWGFCLPHARRLELAPDAEYRVVIDSTLDEAGSLTYGEAVIPGRSDAVFLVSTYVCHPALANEIAGIAVAAGLADSFAAGELRHTIRVVFAPTVIGTLAWLQRNEPALPQIRAGLVVACAGDSGPLTYKRSRRGDTVVDSAAAHVLRGRPGSRVRDFVPWGTDERQFCSPGFDLPVGALTRTPNGEYDGYHTSRDDLDLITPEALADTLDALVEIVRGVDEAVVFERTEPHGEPHLSRHGIDGRMTAALLAGADARSALFWLLNLADGRHDLLQIAERAGVPVDDLARVASSLEDEGILRRVS
jgi:aminopeptidase-like protein